MRSHGKAGLRLLLAGLALVAAYVVLVWFAVFENEDERQVCGAGTPHRDNFFPPYTSCGSGGSSYRMTSAFEEYAGALLFIMALALIVAGAVLLIQSRRGDRRVLSQRSSRR
jgi:hypothetical protein